MKHPILWNAIKSRDIGIEVSPISNQVLKLEDDLRNHPAAFYISENIPIVICNDDPGFWGSRGLSYDFYYAFMAFAPSYSGLEFLKQLGWNSIRYSAMNPREKSIASKLFLNKWDKFMNDVIAGNVV
jgi:adenosine deaminase CECR1